MVVRPCVHFDRLLPLKANGRAAALAANASAAGRVPAVADAAAAAERSDGLALNPSFLNGSSVIGVFDLAVWISSADNPYMGIDAPGSSASFAAAVVAGNALGGSLDVDTVRVDVRGAVVVDNLGWGTVKDMSGKSKFDNLLPATFRVTVNGVVLRRNAAAGSERLGFYLAGEPCSSLPGAASLPSRSALRVANNSAHSSLVGLMLEANDVGEGCSGAVGFNLWRNWDFGVFTVKGILTSVLLVDVIVSDSKHVGVLVLYQGALADPVSVNMTRVGFVGVSGPDACAICNGSLARAADPTCHQKLSRQSYNQATPFTPSVGLASSTFTLLASPGPEFKPWDTVKGYPTILGITTVAGAVFGGFSGAATCGGTHPGAFAIGNHPLDPDAFHPMYFSGVRLPGSSRAAGLLLTTPPDLAWLNEGDCADKAWNLTSGKKMDLFSSGVYDLSALPPELLPINCAGPRHVLLKDTDGSLSGSGVPNSSILGGFSMPRRIEPTGIDQGSFVLPGACQYKPAWGAYLCLPGAQESGLASGWKPQPVPSSGILGDPQFFVLESRDDDRETRVFDPVIFSLPGSGQADLVTNAMDQGCCFAYGFCQKRLNAFWAVLPTGHEVAVNFTGSPGRFWRVWLPYADPSTSLLLQLNFGDVPDRRYLWSARGGRLPPAAARPTLTDGLPGGTYYWDQVAMAFTLKLGGGQFFEVRTESVLYVTPRLAMSVDDFWAQQATFITSLAAVLGIDKSRIRVARVIPGSAVVDIVIGEDPTVAPPLPERPFNMTYNMDVSTSLNVLQQVRSGALPADVSTSSYFTTTDPLSSQPIPDGTGGTIPSPVAPPSPPPASLDTTGASSLPPADPDAPPAPEPAASPSPSPAPAATSPAPAAASCAGAAAAVCELGAVFLTLTAALADGSAQLSLGVPIMSITAEMKAASPDLLAAAQSVMPLPDLSSGSKDLTGLAQQGSQVLAAAAAAASPPAAGPTAMGRSGRILDTKAIGIGASIAGVALGLAVAAGFVVKQRRRRMRIAFTDLSAVGIGDGNAAAAAASGAAAPGGGSGTARRRSRGAAGSSGGGVHQEQQRLVTEVPEPGSGGSHVEPVRSQAALSSAQSLRQLLSRGYSWGRAKAAAAAGRGPAADHPSDVLPGAVPAGRAAGPAAGAAGDGDAEGVVVGSPKVQATLAKKESLRHRGAGLRQPPETVTEAEHALLGSAAGADGSAGAPGAAGGSQRLPPLAGKWKLADRP